MPAHPSLSIIVPTLNEASRLPDLLRDLSAIDRDWAEIVVVDGGSSDATVQIAKSAGARIVSSAPGRGVQLQAGAASSGADSFCFLHADVRVSPPAVAELREVFQAGRTDAWAFRLAIDAPGMKYRLVEHGANLRSRVFHLPYGDQGLLISRALYERAGGFQSVPLMEDVALALALRKLAPIRLLESSILVSSRRWERDGVIGRSARNLLLLARYLAGARPQDLAEHYERSTRG